MTKESIDKYLLANGWQKFIDDDDVDYYGIGNVTVVVPEEKLDSEEYARLLADVLAVVAAYEGITVEELTAKING